MASAVPVRRRLCFAAVCVILSICLPASASELYQVPMRDGVALATEVYLPEEAGPAFPVVLARSVYGRAAGGPIAAQLNAKGLAFVIQDTRGRGDSAGKDRVFHDDGWGERRDGVDTVRWIRAQDWCDGKVGTWGMSALGVVQVMMAAAGAEVDAQAIAVASSEFYGQVAYQGGVFRKHMIEKWTEGQGNSYRINTWKAHPAYDAFWELYDSAARAEHVTAPGVHAGGWWDIFGQGTIDCFVSRQNEGGSGARGNQKLIMGPWVHGVKRKVGDLVLEENFDDVDYNQEFWEFLANWLVSDNGVMEEPAVQYYTVGACGEEGAPGNEWRAAETWPPFETVETPFYLQPGGALVRELPAVDDEDAPAKPQSVSYVYDPEDPCPTVGGANLILPAGPFDQQALASRDDVLTFMTEPLSEPLEVTGRVKVRLHVSSDAPDTDFTAKLLDVYPDGRQILMLDSVRRLKFRDGYAEADPLPPGEMGTLDIDLWSISLIFNKGHRIGVQISSSNYPRFELNPNTGADFPAEGEMRPATNTAYMGAAAPSALLLPIRPD